MKVTKYPQSCLLIENDGNRVLIDPGNLVTPHYGLADFGELDGVIYTHLHGDHLEEAFAKEISQSAVPMYANQDAIKEKLQGIPNVTELEAGNTYKIAGFSVRTYDLPHFSVEGVEMPMNTGLVIADTVFHPGDSVVISGAHADIAAVPIGGPYEDFFKQASELADKSHAKVIIPIHYEGHYKPDPNDFVRQYSGPAEIVVLKNGQSAEL